MAQVVVRVGGHLVPRRPAPCATPALAAPDLQSLLAPDPPHRLAVDPQAFPTQQDVLLSVAPLLMVPGQCPEAFAKVLVVGNQGRSTPLGGAVLGDHGA